ncbi:MAG: GHKL domain-containing protein [Candidatus Krumholzibacteriota bacterium]|nr:GHKL domain-containing protein [Candidatus Krumholzibacteriota bacterium]
MEGFPKISGDRSFLVQVLINLLVNALTYTRQGVDPVIGITHQTEGTDLVVTIADNGIGIEKEYLARVFEVFQRLHNQEEYPGTGIGLAIVRKTVEMHGGKVHIESVPGEGSRVIIRFPLLPESVGQEEG